MMIEEPIFLAFFIHKKPLLIARKYPPYFYRIEVYNEEK